MAQVIWTRPALDDVHGIASYVAQDSLAAADHLVDRLFEAPTRLEQFPFAGGVVNEIADRSVREVLSGNYRILYVVRGDDCFITAVVHSARDLGEIIEPRMWEPDVSE